MPSRNGLVVVAVANTLRLGTLAGRMKLAAIGQSTARLPLLLFARRLAIGAVLQWLRRRPRVDLSSLALGGAGR